MSYLKQLINNHSPLVMKRKKEYIQYNFGYLINQKLAQKNVSVLEIGPGMGEFISYCNEHGVVSVDIVDLEKEALQEIKKIYQVRNMWLSGDVSSIEGQLSNYDIIMMTQVLEHIPPNNHITYLRSLYRLLKKGGFIIITVPNIGNPLAIFERYYDYTHKTAFTENSLTQLVDFLNLKGAKIKLQPFNIPQYSFINIFRYCFQQVLHMLFKILFMINGGVIPSIFTTNITLIIEKTV